MRIRTETPKLRVSKSLLDSWLWVFKKDDGYEDFLRTLDHKPMQMNQAMLDGQRFENCVNGVLDGNPIPEDHEWYKGVTTMAEYLEGAQQQVELYADAVVDGYPVLLHGILDYLRAGVIYDCKFSKSYHLNKYLNSSQHPMYLALVPKASRFEYLSSDGTWMYKEVYPRDIVEPIEVTIHQFYGWLKQQGLFEYYKIEWSGKHK